MQEIIQGAAEQMDVIHQDTSMFINQEIYAALAVDVVRMDFATNWQKYQQNFNDLLTSFKFSFNMIQLVWNPSNIGQILQNKVFYTDRNS